MLWTVYPIQEKELLAIIHALKIWRNYLLDRPFIAETDHKSLERLLQQKEPGNTRLIRWFDFLSEFPITIRYIQGKENSIADVLSRRDCNHVKRQDLIEEIANEQQNDDRCQDIRNQIELNKKTAFEIDSNGLIIFKHREHARIYIPNHDLQTQLMSEFHNPPMMGHPGSDKLLKKLSEHFYWPRMIRSVRKFVQTCERCQRNKHTPGKQPGSLMLMEIPENRWTHLEWDFIVDLPRTNDNYNAIWTIVDRLTRRAHFFPLTTTTNAEELAQIFVERFIPLHGCPTHVISDRDPKFEAKFWKEIIRSMGIEQSLSAAYRPQTDGMSERTNQTVTIILRHYANAAQDNWKKLLGLAKFTYNSNYHSSIGMAPFQADLGYVPRLPINHMLPTQLKTTKSFIKQLHEIITKVQQKAKETQEKIKLQYDKGKREQKFQVGELVLVSTQHMRPQHAGFERRKLAPKYIGPYRVIEQVTPRSYRLKLPNNIKLCNIFHTASLKPYRKDEDRNRTDKQINVNLGDGTEGTLIDQILQSRVQGNQKQYLVQWTASKETTCACMLTIIAWLMILLL